MTKMFQNKEVIHTIDGNIVGKNMVIGIDLASGPDTRYNKPKEKVKATVEEIDATIESNEIYRELRDMLLDAQRQQVGYGIDKYPEPLNADTWTLLETLDHSIAESVDKLHYDIMLRNKLRKIAEEELIRATEEFKREVEKTFDIKGGLR